MIESNIYLEMILHANLDLTRFDKFVCQNDTAGAMNTPPKWLILLNSGVVIPPERLFFLRFGVVAPRASRPVPQAPCPKGHAPRPHAPRPMPQGISTGPPCFQFLREKSLADGKEKP